MAQLVANNRVGSTHLCNVIDTIHSILQDDISRLYIRRSDENRDVTGTISLNPNDETQLMINWDLDSFPSNTIINGSH